jgi:hypothetical protein
MKGSDIMSQTIVNGKEYKYYDQFTIFIDHLETEFIEQKNYKGYPKLPDDFNDGFHIYLNANGEERRFIFGYLYILYIESLRHWKVDKDMLWTEEGRKEYEEYINKMKSLLPYMKQWSSFRN